MFTRAIALDGGNWDVYRNYGHFLYDNERYEEAIAQYSRVLDFTPDSGIGFDNLGNAYWAIGDFESAADAYRKAIELEHSRWAYSNLGSMQYYLGQYDASVENQKAAIELAPEDHVAWGRLAEASRFIPGKEKDVLDAYAKAIELVKKDLLINPDDWNNIGLLAVYDAFGGHPDEALAQVERMLTLAPMEPSAHYYDALVEWQLGDADATYEALKSALAFGMSPVFIVRDPTLAPALKEARFEALVELHGD
jgi:tetratricopeptide (TPR) repeat protein